MDAASSSLATPTKGESKGTHPFHFLLNLIYYGQYSSKRRVISLRVRDRFIEIIDENEENLFSQRIKNIRKQIKKIFKHLHETCAVIEPCEFMLIWGTLQRCLICIESCISLVSDGYIGSANALFRQIYEFLVWAKVGIDSDTETLKEVNAAFYKGDLSHRILVTNILKAVKIDITNGSYSETELKAKGKELYHGYSLLTHASDISQQVPYKQENFYVYLNECLSEISLLFDVFLVVFSQYLDSLYAPFIDESSLSEKEKGYLWAAKVHAGEIKYQLPLYHKELHSKQKIGMTFLQIAFMEKWQIDRTKLNLKFRIKPLAGSL